MAARLIVLNGPPASGKSTLARRYADEHPLALRLDIDELRDWLSAWSTDLHAAGLRARDLAVAMAEDHLRSGHEVAVAQLFGRPDHLDRLVAAATGVGADVAEVVLVADRAGTRARFVERGGPRLAEVEAGPPGLDALDELHDRVERVAVSRPHVVRVEPVWGDVDATYARLLAAIGER